MQRKQMINQNAKGLKELVLRFFENSLEEGVWIELSNSLTKDGFYTHYDHDIPLLRDLKAFINMVEAVERMTAPYPLRIIAIFKVPQAYLAYNRSDEVWESTEGALTHYIEYADKLTKQTLLPLIYSKMVELKALCTRGNLDKASVFFTKQIIRLENYKKYYALVVNKKIKEPEEKSEFANELLIKVEAKYHEILKKLYKEKLAAHFSREKEKEKESVKSAPGSVEIVKETGKENEKIKDSEKEEDIQFNIFLELEKEKSETVKNLKRISSSLVGIRKFLHDYESYSQADTLSKMLWMPALYSDLRGTFSIIQNFNYKVIIAEQANPAVEYIKRFLADLAKKLEEIACKVDGFETLMRFREGSLLQYVGELIAEYNKIMSALNIPIDFVRQKRLYLKARLQVREQNLAEVTLQLNQIEKLLNYNHHPILAIPKDILVALQNFILKYSDDIAIDRQKLASYKEYLAFAMRGKANLQALVMLPLEFAGNCFDLTIHAKIMASLEKMQLYLQKEKLYYSQKVNKAKSFNASHPFDYFKSSDLAIKEHRQLALAALRHRAVELNEGKERSFLKLTETHNDESKEIKHDVAPIVKKSAPFVDEKMSLAITSQVKEQGIFRVAVEKGEKGEDLQLLLDWMRLEESVGPQSRALLSEIDEVLQQPTANKLKLG